jgi:uncharacterized phage-like protein YoqJ
MKEYSCCFSGHRILPEGLEEQIQSELQMVIEALVKKGVYKFYAGGALGFDLLAALCVLKQKEKIPNIKLVLVLPCKFQAKFWKKEDVEKYDEIKAAADDIIYTADAYYRGCMHKRNRYMIDHSDICICYLTNTTGGTKYTVKYGEKQGKQIINLARKEAYEIQLPII